MTGCGCIHSFKMAVSGGGLWSPTSSISIPDSPLTTEYMPYIRQSSILQWNADNINEWLKREDLEIYCSLFAEHEITCGAVLLQLTDEHFKEMGLTKVGARLRLTIALDKLRLEAGFFPTAKFSDSNYLLNM